MATVQHTAPRGFSKALSGVRSAVFPVTSAVLVTIPCDIPRWRTPAGTAMLFVPVNGFECDGTHLTHDGELVIVALLEKRDMLRFIYPDMSAEDLPRREAENRLAMRFKTRVDTDHGATAICWQKVA